MLSPLEKSILATIIYFDIFNYPLTSFEVYKYLISPKGAQLKAGYASVKQALETSPLLRKKIESQHGFYFLLNRSSLINIRRQRYLLAGKKLANAKKYFRLLAKIPFVTGVSVCNSLSYSNAREESDIDVAIICRPGTIWLVRSLAVFLIDLFKKRPTEDNLKNKICLSFYLSEDGLNLEECQSECPDIHFIVWLSQFLPIYSVYPDQIFHNNLWIKQYLPNAFAQLPNRARRVEISEKKLCEKILCRSVIKFLSKPLKNYQLKILPTRLRLAAKEPNTNVMLSDQIIKLHVQDKRQEYNQRWRLKYQALIKHYEQNIESR
ncbi:MAG: hypothetical protein ACOZBH_00860 [Patescibacteria group bacterium]